MMKKVLSAMVAAAMAAGMQAQNTVNGTRRVPQVGTNRAQGQQIMRFEHLTPEQRTAYMADKLSLTADQKAKVLALNTEYADVLDRPMGHRPEGARPGRKGIQRGDSTTQRSFTERLQPSDQEMQQIRQRRMEYQQKLDQILTPEQRAQLPQRPMKMGQHK